MAIEDLQLMKVTIKTSRPILNEKAERFLRQEGNK